jgi:hypothetical protein
MQPLPTVVPVTYDAVTAITVQLALVLALSFVIERILEMVKATYDVADGRYNWYKFWTQQTYRTQAFIEQRLRLFNYVDRNAAAALLARFDGMLLGRSAAAKPVVPVLCGDLVRAAWCRVVLKIMGAAIGIAFAFAFRLDLVALIKVTPGAALPPVGILGMTITGITIGLGSGIVHKVISTVERKQERNAEVARAA